MRLPLIAAAALGGFMMLTAAPAQAAFMFGEDETIRALVDVGVVGQDDEKLELGYKTTTQIFLLPYTISDDGYVLVQKEDHTKFYDITPEQIKDWQAAGLIPDPLPPYEIPLMDKIFGYLLWPTLVVIALVYLVPMLRKKKPAEVAAGSPVGTPDDKGPVT